MSVFTRRRIKGLTMFLSFWQPSGLPSRFLEKSRNSSEVPRRPLLRKSNRDQRLVRSFSMGVPVMATRWAARSFLIARVCLVPGFLMACVSSRMTAVQSLSCRAASLLTMP